MAKLAYLFPAFPVFHQTFVLWEVLGLRRNGVSPCIYSLRRPTAAQQPEGREIARDVVCLPPTWSREVMRANWQMLRREIGQYLQLYVAVFTAWRTGATRPPADNDVARRRVRLSNRVRGWFNSQPILYLLKSWSLVPRSVYLAGELERQGVTHLHVHWASYPATVAYVVQRICGVPFSMSAHAYDIYMVPRMLPAKLREARFVVTCAKTNADYLTHLAGPDAARKVIVNYHGVDVERFAPPPSIRPRSESVSIVSCGQLERYKGMHLLIDACAELRRRGTVFECSIVGEGEQRVALQRQIDRLGLTDRVHLLGARPHAEVAVLYRHADLFVLASELAGKSGRRDVIANVIVEAMAAGLPVVASHIPGVEELVDDGVTGYLFPPNRVDCLTAAMVKLANAADERTRFGQAGRRRVVRDFDSAKNIRVLASLLSEATEGAASRAAMAGA